MSKDEAILFVLKAIKSPMMMTSKPTREQVFKAAEEHKITAIDLLNKLQEIVWNVWNTGRRNAILQKSQNQIE